MATAILNAARLRELLSYDPETGVFTLRVARGSEPAGAVAGHLERGYRRISVDGKLYYAHRLAWLYVYGTWPLLHIDHINNTRDDNRISNLRDVSRTVNNQNLKVAQANNKTGVLGVYFHKKANKYQASIMVNGVRKHLGLFASSGDASAAYLEAKHHFAAIALPLGCDVTAGFFDKRRRCADA